MAYAPPQVKTLELTHQDAALRITLNRPDVLNALSLDLLGELRDALQEAAEADDIRAVLLTGAGRGFCAGADLASTPVEGNFEEMIQTYYNPVVRAIATMPKPVVAGVNGVAAGAGMSLALACDTRLLSSSAAFAVGFTGIGLVMDASASYFLPRLVGRGRAFELAYSGRKVGAEEALRLGFGEQIIPAETFAESAWEMTQRLAQGPTKAFALVKEQLNASAQNDLEAQLGLEAQFQEVASNTADVREGVTAFKEKRKPNFRGE